MNRYPARLRAALILFLLSVVAGYGVWRFVAYADNTAQTLPFSQNWTNTGLITADDNWNGVPGIIGFRGDDITTSTGIDPQTLLADGTNTPVDVIANQSNPNITNGGIAEFDGIANPTIALQGSGTADAPFILINLNTTGLGTIRVQYSVRDLDASADNAVQQVALHFRVGNSGAWTNVPGAYIADATQGPSLAGLSKPIDVTLPAAANDVPLLQIRVMTTNAVGNDEWVGIDDIQVSGLPVSTPTDPSGAGAADPATVSPGDSTRLTVAVTPGTNPTSSGLAVTADLSGIGGSASQAFFDDGSNGDLTAGDNVFSFLATVGGATTPGLKMLPVTITDAQSRSGSASIALTVQGQELVVISQVYGGGGNAGATLTHDFIEIFNRGSVAVSLNGWSVQYSSANGSSWQVTPLTNVTLQPGQYYLIEEAQGAAGTTPLPAPDATGGIAMAAGAGKVALVNTTAPLTGTCPLGSQVVDFVGYGNASCSEGGAAAPQLSNTTAAQRARGGCRDTNNNGVDFAAGAPNPRNTLSPLRDCSVPPPTFAIHDIQGSGPVTPLAGQEITTTGIVTAKKTNGFFLQTPDPEADADPATSQAIFVFTSAAPAVAVGDAVSVVGTAGEFFNLTQLGSSNFDITVTSSGNPLPAAIPLTQGILNPAGPPDQLERFEGMRMSAAELISVAPTNEFFETVAVLPGVPRPLREPGINISDPLPPGAPCCVPRFDENPERIMIDGEGQAGVTPINVTSGVTITNVVGPLDFTFDNYKIIPDATPAVSANLSAVPVPEPAAGEFTIGSFNLENFFTTNANFADRLAKASLAIRNVMRSPDIIGVEEVGDLNALAQLANKINADAVAAGGDDPQYVAFLEETDNDAQDATDIDVGFLVKSSRVNVASVTQFGAGATYINPLNGQPELLNDRAPLVLRAGIPRPGGPDFPVTVIVNHLRSLIDIEQDPGEGPRVREKRRKQAEFLAGLIQSLQDENLVVLGDFNAFQFNDGYVDVMGTLRGVPTAADEVVLASPDLVEPNLTNLVEGLPAVQRYSFIFEGNPQVLDHVLVDGEMLAQLSRFAYARNNADFPETFSADATRPERLSDHDMPVAYFTLPPVITDITIAKSVSSPALTGGDLTYTITVTNHGPAPAASVVVSNPLPAGTAYVSCSATGGGSCGGTGTAMWASIAPNTSQTYTMVVSIDYDTPVGTKIDSTATVSTTSPESNGGNNTASASVTVAASQKLTPIVECVTSGDNKSYVATFGYDNPNPVAITIPVGYYNRFTPPPADGGQVTRFLPGRQFNAFSASSPVHALVWHLTGNSVSVNRNHAAQCP